MIRAARFACFLLVCLTPSAGGARDVATPLRLLTYNIRHGAGMDGKVDLARTAAVIAGARPDLVALQEVDRNCQRSGGVDVAVELGRLLSMEHAFGKFMDFQGGEYGMAVLSRLPLREVLRHPLPAGGEPRCALEVQVRVDALDATLSFVSIHNDWQDEQVRVRQVGALVKALEQRRHPVILAGDFNGEPADASLKLLGGAGWQVLDKGGRKTFPAPAPEVEIDFFVVRGLPGARFEQRVIDEREASDHRPLEALVFPGKPGGEGSGPGVPTETSGVQAPAKAGWEKLSGLSGGVVHGAGDGSRNLPVSGSSGLRPAGRTTGAFAANPMRPEAPWNTPKAEPSATIPCHSGRGPALMARAPGERAGTPVPG